MQEILFYLKIEKILNKNLVKLIILNLRASVQQNTSLIKWNNQPQTWKRYSHSILLTKYHFLEYTKNSYKSIRVVSQNPIEKMTKSYKQDFIELENIIDEYVERYSTHLKA